jgi:hypothetical protein
MPSTWCTLTPVAGMMQAAMDATNRGRRRKDHR